MLFECGQKLFDAPLRDLRHAVASDANAVMEDIGIVRIRLLHRQISHHDAVDNVRRMKVAPQSLFRILVPRRPRHGIKILPSAIVQMSINDLHVYSLSKNN